MPIPILSRSLPPLLLIGSLVACGTRSGSTTPPTLDRPLEAGISYSPVDPVSFWDHFQDAPGVPACRSLDEDPGCSTREILANFPNDATQVSIFKLEADGQLSAPFVGLSSRGSLYRVIVDYVKYRTDIVEDCVFRSGFGIRMRAELETSKSGLDISSPIGIGFNAQLGHLSGSLRFETIGLSGKIVTTLVPIPSQISAESIQKAMEAAASIKANIYNSVNDDDDVFVEPQVFARKCKNPSEEIESPRTGAIDPMRTPSMNEGGSTPPPEPSPPADTEAGPVDG